MAVSVRPPFERRDAHLPLRGRPDLLAELSDVLMRIDSQPRVRVLHGLNGCGKTSLALELAYEANGLGVDVWWVEAAEETTFLAGLDAITAELDPARRPPGDPDTLWRELERRDRPWLLIINDADSDMINGSAGGARWIRPLSNCSGLVVITSRDVPEAWTAFCGVHRVPMLDSGDATQVLDDYTHGRAGTTEQATKLAERLGGLPLALSLAGAYLADTTKIPDGFVNPDAIRSYGAYQAALDTGRLNVGELEDVHQHIVGQMWDLSLDLLARRRYPEARTVLQLLSCLDNAPVPFLLLVQAYDELPATPANLPSDKTRLWRVLMSLQRLDLIDLQDAGLWVHPLVRDAGRHHLERDPEATSYFRLLATMLEHASRPEVLGPPDDPGRRSAWQAIAPHAFHVLGAVAGRTDMPTADVERVIRSAMQAARHLAARGLYHQAEVEWRAIKEAAERRLGETDRHALTSGREYAVALSARGSLRAAEGELRSVLRRHGEPDLVEALSTRHELATVLRALGQLGAAEQEYRAVLAGRQTHLGANHPDTLDTRYNLARLLHARGQLTEAQNEFDALLAVARHLHGPDHHTSLTYQHQSARVLRARGLLKEALDAFDATLEARQRVLGADHPDTLVTRHHRARVLRALGRSQEAAGEFGEVWATQRRELGDDHPETLASHHQWARVRWSMGRFADAEREFDSVLAARRRTLGEKHPDTLTTRVQRARVVRAQSRLDEAESEFDAVLAARTDLLGADHPDTLATRHNIAHVWRDRGRLVAARDLYAEVLVAQSDKIGERHPDTLATRHNLASVRLALGDLELAKVEFETVLRLRQEALGAQHPETMATRHSHIGVLRTLNREEADAQLQATLRFYQSSGYDPATLDRLARARGRLAEAEANFEAALTAFAALPQQRTGPAAESQPHGTAIPPPFG